MDTAVRADHLFEKGSLEQQLQMLEDNGGHAARLRMLGRMSSSFVLDMRQPLAVIVTDCGTAQRILTSCDDGVQRIDSLLARIADCARWADDVVGRVDRMVTRRAPICSDLDLNSIGKGALQFVQCESFSRSIPLRFSLLSKSGVLGDEVQLHQVIASLLTEAIQVSANADTGKRAVVLATVDDEAQVILTIGLNGGPDGPCDCAGEDIDPCAGASFGPDIAVCKAVIEAHRGILDIYPGETGLLFRIKLPRTSGLQASSVAVDPPSIDQARGEQPPVSQSYIQA